MFVRRRLFASRCYSRRAILSLAGGQSFVAGLLFRVINSLFGLLFRVINSFFGFTSGILSWRSGSLLDFKSPFVGLTCSGPLLLDAVIYFRGRLVVDVSMRRDVCSRRAILSLAGGQSFVAVVVLSLS
jgi:hypothetical protein